MGKDIRFLLVFLIVALAILVWIQNQQCDAIPNSGSLSMNNVQHFTNDNTNSSKNSSKNYSQNYSQNSSQNSSQNQLGLQSNKTRGLSVKEDSQDKNSSSRESQKVTSRIIDNILKNHKNNGSEQELDSLISHNELSEMNSQFNNPIRQDINTEKDNLFDSDQEVLDELIKEVNTGNDLLTNSPRAELYRSKAKSIDSAKKYRNVSYKDSKYRYDFNDNGDPSQASQDELNSMYDDSVIFRNNEYNTNGNFKGYSQNSELYGNADLKEFSPNGPQSQQDKILSLYNSNEYLPNSNLLDNKLTKGFQILDNPVAVSNPNLIPVLKSIPVSSVMGSNKNATYDIRSEPPCPKTVVSPFLNSSIMPDIYSTQRGCL